VIVEADDRDIAWDRQAKFLRRIIDAHSIVSLKQNSAVGVQAFAADPSRNRNPSAAVLNPTQTS